MRLLYGVVGEGMGHATRSAVVLEHLLERGHLVQVVVSGRAHGFLRERFGSRPHIAIAEIQGLHLVMDEVAVDRSASLWSNLQAAPESLRHNLRTYREIAGAFRAEAVISDFESWAFLYGRAHDLPVVSIDNMQVHNRCRHPREVTGGRSMDALLTKAGIKSKLPGAWHYLVTSFFFPPVRKERTTLVPPILRPEVLQAIREPGEHVLVYQAAEAVRALLPVLRRLPGRFHVYGLGEEGVDGNITLRPFSSQGFVDDLRTARAVVAGGGYSLLGEAVHLRVPVLSVPLARQYEQDLNARWLEHLGYGQRADALTAETMDAFLARLPDHERALQGYVPRDNGMLLACVDEILERIGRGDPPPLALDTPAMGDWATSRTAEQVGEDYHSS